MAKEGLVFDYDLKANEHVGKNLCAVCGESLQCRWTDLNGEGVCLTCGVPYQLVNGTDEQIAGGKYPYCNVNPEWLPIVKRHWEETHLFVFLGTSFSEITNQSKFCSWAKKNYPEKFAEKAP